MPLTNFTVAGALEGPAGMLPKEVQQYFRVQFYAQVRKYNYTDKEVEQDELIWIDAVPCKDLYLGDDPVYATEDAYDTEEFYQNEFNLTYRQWICPDTSSGNITLHNDPRNFDEGMNFVMVVNRCSVAQA